MITKIMVPVDGSEAGEMALPAALAVASRTGAKLHIAHVRTMEWLIAPPEEEDHDPERSYLHRLCERVSAQMGESVTYALLPDTPPVLLTASPSPRQVAELLAKNAVSEGVDLFVATTHGRGGLSRLWFGSVAEALLRAASAPLLLLRPTEEAGASWASESPLRHVLVPLDPTDESSAAVLPAAMDLGAPFDATYTLVSVVTPLLPVDNDMVLPLAVPMSGGDVEQTRAETEKALGAAAELIRSAGMSIQVVAIVDASPARAILRYAEERDMDVIAVATHARRGVDRILLGSVADKLIRGTDRPLLVVPPRS